LRAVAHRVAELLRLLDGFRLDLWSDDLAYGRDPVGDDVPLLAVPLLDEHGAIAFMVLAGHLDRMRKALHADLLEPLLGQVEILEAPAHFLAGERLLAELRHRGTDRLGREHRVDDAPVVERRADRLLLRGALPLVVDVLDDVRVHLEAGARRVERRALIAAGSLAGRNHV